MPQHRFFDDEGFEFMALITLGSAPYRLSEAGEVYATTDRITNADPDSWFDEWMATARRVRSIAEHAEAAGHIASARDAYLRAANYAASAFFYVLATKDPSRELATWRWHRECFDHAMRLWPTPVEHISVPYDGTHLHGYFWSAGPEPRPTIILNNGSDGPVSDMLEMGVVDALARGYHAMTFDGPGQGRALYEQKLYFRYDWEAVITPVVDYLLKRHDVDPGKLVLAGNSQGGYWVPRAAAFEHRLAAIVADPGVVDVRTSWTGKLPAQMLQLLDAGQDAEFDQIMTQIEDASSEVRTSLAKRIEPYGLPTLSAVLHELDKWNLTDVAAQITCPTLITDPEDEQFWPGQSQQLFDLMTAPGKEITHFTAAEGASWHCEPMAPQVRGQRIFDWIDGVLT